MGLAMRMRKMAMGALGAALVLLSGAARAEPMLWKIEDGDSILYLFGTIHILDPQISWRDARLMQAFAGAQEIWFEIDPVKSVDAAAIAPYRGLMFDPTRPLSKRLSPEEFARFTKAANALGLPAAQLDSLRPWMAALQLTRAALVRAGADPDAGVDRQLAGEVGARPLKTLETLEQQLRFFADAPEEVEHGFLLSTLDELDEGPGYFQDLVAAWRDGDDARLEQRFLGDMRRAYPQAYDILLKQRNLAWAMILDQEMRKSGSDFVAVGALHLVGPDGVPNLLRAKGYRVTRMDR